MKITPRPGKKRGEISVRRRKAVAGRGGERAGEVKPENLHEPGSCLVHPANDYLRCFSRIRCFSRKGSMASHHHSASQRHSHNAIQHPTVIPAKRRESRKGSRAWRSSSLHTSSGRQTKRYAVRRCNIESGAAGSTSQTGRGRKDSPGNSESE